ncbi:hypothetical protein OCU04_012368 [Sclerotinia nivalis]|uniref:Uncharacterized protein n=1 Tax=Sclerotinia nivalis TaxID=352851 RepID=A0A9X0ABK8_9HELO|nr:hypothetical protein OCU04_012368 [Sclerotinia nivalis]
MVLAPLNFDTTMALSIPMLFSTGSMYASNLSKRHFFAKADELFMRLRQDVSKPVGLGEGELSTIDFLMWLGCPAQAYYYGINMVMDKAALENRIKNDAIRHQRHLVWARERRIWMDNVSSSDDDEDDEDEDEDSK